MRKYSHISYRYIKENKRRSILTIFAIIMSVALMNGILTMGMSLQSALIKETKVTNGDYEIMINDVNKDQINQLNQYVNLQRSEVIPFYGFAEIKKKGEYEQQSYLKMVGFDQIPSKTFQYELTSGTFPKNSSEILIQKETMKLINKDLKIGDSIELNIGDIEDYILNSDSWPQGKVINGTTKTYKIVGTFERPNFSPYDLFQMLITKTDTSTLAKSNTAYVTVENKKDIFLDADRIKELLQVNRSQVSVNENLTRLYAQSSNPLQDSAIIGLVTVLFSIILVFTISVIYGSFSMLVIEKTKEFGILRGIGATPKQIKKIVLNEALFYALVGIPFGIISTYLGLGIVLSFLGELKFLGHISKYFELGFYPFPILFVSFIAFLTILISVYLPARTAGKISALSAIRSSTLIKKEKYRKRRLFSKFFKLIFGLEGEIAYKNIMRTKRKFITILFALTLSTAIFVAFSGLISLSAGLMQMYSNNYYNITISATSVEAKEYVKEKLKNYEGIERISENVSHTTVQFIPFKDFSDDAKRYNQIYSQSSDRYIITDPKTIDPNYPGVLYEDAVKYTLEGKEYLDISTPIEMYDDNELDYLSKYLTSGTTNLKAGEVVISNRILQFIYTSKGQKRIVSDFTNLKVGDTIYIIDPIKWSNDFKGPDENNPQDYAKILQENVTTFVNDGNYIPLKIAGIVDGAINQESPMYSIIISEDTYNQFEKIETDTPFWQYVNIEAYMPKNKDHEKLNEYLQELQSDGYIQNFNDTSYQANQDFETIKQLSVFVYGFILIVSLISAMNIINTISANLLQRNKEFAMFRAIGMSKHQMNKLVILEGTIAGILAAIFGNLIGVGLNYLLYKQTTGIIDFGYQLPITAMLISIVFTIGITLGATYLPLRKIAKQNIMENMKID